jgi:hypothetical protein
MADDVEVFNVDAAKIRKGALAIGLGTTLLSLVIAAEILASLPAGRSVRVALAAAVVLIAVVGSVVVWFTSSRREVRLSFDSTQVTLDYLGHHTELPWSDIQDVGTTRPGDQGYLLLTPGPEVELAGRWRQQWWYRNYTDNLSGARTPFPRWSPTRKGQLELVSLGWFAPAARPAIVAAARRHVR